MPRTSAVRRLIQDEDEDALRGLVDAARNDELGDEDLAELAQGLANSGARLRAGPRAADLASTGGPSSLSTLVCPLFLRAHGFIVPKLGVFGRPAGGVDVLQQVPGFDAALDLQSAERALRRYGYIHLVADEKWAPLDARLFEYRQRAGAQSLPALVIASILSKKLAVGAIGAGLEIRVARHGNFGTDYVAARLNAHRFRAVADLLNLRPVVVLTDASLPYQPYIGRGEALLALSEILSDDADGSLADHLAACRQMADALAAAMGVASANRINGDAIRHAHEEVLKAHGSSPAAFDGRVAEVREAPRTVMRAKRSGVVGYDLDLMRTLLVKRQREVDSPRPADRPPDPAGVILLAKPGGKVAVGETLISVRVPEGEANRAAQLGACARIQPATEAQIERPSSLVEVI